MIPPSEIPTLIEDCERRCSQLSDWEVSFIDSIAQQIGRGKGLTPKQVEKLETIWERVTG